MTRGVSSADWHRRDESPGSKNSPYAWNRWDKAEEAPSHWRGKAAAGCRLWVGGHPRIESQSAAQAAIREIFKGYRVQAITKQDALAP